MIDACIAFNAVSSKYYPQMIDAIASMVLVIRALDFMLFVVVYWPRILRRSKILWIVIV